MKNINLLLPVCAVFALFAPLNTLANDSEAAFAIGGLKLVKNLYISIEKEDLYISPDLVKVDYVFTNNSNKDVEATIAFPLPIVPQPIEEFFWDNRIPDYENLNFTTLVDGEAVNLTMVKIPKLKNKDISADLEAYSLPIEWFETDAFDPETMEAKLFGKFSKSALSNLEKKGIIRKMDGHYVPNWQVEYNIVRKQIFKANSNVKVSHSYRPMIGGSVGGSLEKDYRKDSLKYYQKKYCVDKVFLNAFDKKLSDFAKEAAKSKNSEQYNLIATETWISYILKSGANWAGPIKDFRLVVDKKSSNDIVSFCMDNVKKISPTQFEVNKKNFEPKADLDILIVNFHKIEN